LNATKKKLYFLRFDKKVIFVTQNHRERPFFGRFWLARILQYHEQNIKE